MQALAAAEDKLSLIDRARAEELEELAEIKHALAAQQQEHAASSRRAQDRLKKVC